MTTLLNLAVAGILSTHPATQITWNPQTFTESAIVHLCTGPKPSTGFVWRWDGSGWVVSFDVQSCRVDTIQHNGFEVTP